MNKFFNFRSKDAVAILGGSLLLSIIAVTFYDQLSQQNAFIISILLTSIFLAFVVNLVNKNGTGLSFLVLTGLLTNQVYDIGLMGGDKVLVFLLAGIVFEIINALFYLEFKRIQVDLILSTSITMAVLPFLGAYLLSPELTKEMFTAVLNLTILGFIVGVIGATLSFVLWHELRTSKIIIKFKYRA